MKDGAREAGAVLNQDNERVVLRGNVHDRGQSQDRLQIKKRQ
jgi:hypothetical protein